MRQALPKKAGHHGTLWADLFSSLTFWADSRLFGQVKTGEKLGVFLEQI
jgi:hypothetical protein